MNKWRLICALLVFIMLWMLIRASLLIAVYHYENVLLELDKPQTVDKQLVERVRKHYHLDQQ